MPESSRRLRPCFLCLQLAHQTVKDTRKLSKAQGNFWGCCCSVKNLKPRFWKIHVQLLCNLTPSLYFLRAHHFLKTWFDPRQGILESWMVIMRVTVAKPYRIFGQRWMVEKFSRNLPYRSSWRLADIHVQGYSHLPEGLVLYCTLKFDGDFCRCTHKKSDPLHEMT